MNERIEQLADQCMTERQDSNGVYVEYFDHKKFAELIVKECINIVGEYSEDGAYCQRQMIKERFGVE